jgi:hypothetical protein
MKTTLIILTALLLACTIAYVVLRAHARRIAAEEGPEETPSDDANPDERIAALQRRAAGVPVSQINEGQALRSSRELFESGDTDAALVQLFQALRVRPENPFPCVHIGKICMTSGWKRPARRFFDLALRNARSITSDTHRATFVADVRKLLDDLKRA